MTQAWASRRRVDLLFAGLVWMKKKLSPHETAHIITCKTSIFFFFNSFCLIFKRRQTVLPPPPPWCWHFQAVIKYLKSYQITFSCCNFSDALRLNLAPLSGQIKPHDIKFPFIKTTLYYLNLKVQCVRISHLAHSYCELIGGGMSQE